MIARNIFKKSEEHDYVQSSMTKDQLCRNMALNYPPFEQLGPGVSRPLG